MAKKKPILPACYDCKHFFPDKRGSSLKSYLGICRRYPPIVTEIDEDGLSNQINPTVEHDWLCGEHCPVIN